MQARRSHLWLMLNVNTIPGAFSSRSHYSGAAYDINANKCFLFEPTWATKAAYAGHLAVMGCGGNLSEVME